MIPMTQQKEKIISMIKLKGPSLPVQIAKNAGISGLFAGAFLSEIYADKKIKISNIRVGSSPLYYIEGQENMLENFVEHLNIREKEAFFFLKKAGILEDEVLTPVIRVALREIKDFAIPIKVKFNDTDKIFWRYHLLEEKEARNRIQEALNPKIKEENVKKQEVEVKKQEVEIRPIESKPLEVSVKSIAELEINNIKGKLEREARKSNKTKKIEPLKVENEDKFEIPIKIKKEIRDVVIKENEFPLRIKKYLSSKDVEIFESLLDKKKEFLGKIRINTMFGKQEFFLVAKDKKTISDNDLAIALQTAQSARMPVLVISPGELNKRAQEYIAEWKNLIRFEKMKI